MKDKIKIVIYQNDELPAFAGYLSPSLKEMDKAVVGLSIENLVATVAMKDIAPDELPYFIAESIMHEVIHVLEDWADVEFSEERVDLIIQAYQEKYKSMKETMSNAEEFLNDNPVPNQKRTALIDGKSVDIEEIKQKLQSGEAEWHTYDEVFPKTFDPEDCDGSCGSICDGSCHDLESGYNEV